MSWVRWTFGAFLLLILAVTSHQEGVGPFDIELKIIEQCDETGLNLVRLNELPVIKKVGVSQFEVEVNISADVEVGSDTEGKIDVTVMKNDVPQEHFYVHEYKDVCAEMDKYFADVKRLMLRFTGREECPFAKGHFKSKGLLTLTLPEGTVPALPYGTYIAHSYMYQHGDIITCWKFTTEIVPKKGLLKKKKKKHPK